MQLKTAIIILGGEKEREIKALELYQTIKKEHPDFPFKAIISSCEASDQDIYQLTRGLTPDYNGDYGIIIDRRAVDTVTNFTRSFGILKQLEINKVIIATSKYHMRRAFWIGMIILGTKGIHIEKLEVNQGRKLGQESLFKVVRDCIRAYIWLFLG
ncbi:unnamed protein product, partial [Heterosigma akashiwo]